MYLFQILLEVVKIEKKELYQIKQSLIKRYPKDRLIIENEFESLKNNYVPLNNYKIKERSLVRFKKENKYLNYHLREIYHVLKILKYNTKTFKANILKRYQHNESRNILQN